MVSMMEATTESKMSASRQDEINAMTSAVTKVARAVILSPTFSDKPSDSVDVDSHARRNLAGAGVIIEGNVLAQNTCQVPPADLTGETKAEIAKPKGTGSDRGQRANACHESATLKSSTFSYIGFGCSLPR